MTEASKQALIDMAVKYYKDGFYDDAVRVCKNILIMDSGCITAYYGIAKSLIKLGKYNEALDIYGKALAINKTKELYKQRGDLNFMLKEYESAYKDYVAAKILGYNRDEIMPKVLATFKLSEEEKKKRFEDYLKRIGEKAKLNGKVDYTPSKEEIEEWQKEEIEEWQKEQWEIYAEELSIASSQYWEGYYTYNDRDEYVDTEVRHEEDWY